MTAYEKYFGNIEKTVKSIVCKTNVQCPSFLSDDIYSEGCFDGLSCRECWKKALEQEVDDD